MSKIEQHISKLGTKARDKVTGSKGVVTSVTFDLYGCIQVILTPEAKEDGTLPDGRWFDIGRIEPIHDDPISDARVMDVPDFNAGPIAEGKKGPAEKPLP